jgi:hypothetical protein
MRTGRAFFEVLNERCTGQVLPVLRLGEQLPAPVRMIRGSLSAQRCHRAQAADVFHSLTSRGFPHLILCFCVRVMIINMTENYFLVLEQRGSAGCFRFVFHIGFERCLP